MAVQELNLDIRRLRRGRLAAGFVPELAMVCCSLTDGGAELLDQRRGLAAYAASGSTMGIPLLHPWANRLDAPLPESRLLRRDANGLAIHGVVPSALPFAVIEAGEDRLSAEFSTDHSPGVLDVFPHPHALRMEATLEPGRLVIETTLRATGQVAVPVAFGHHPYLHPPAGRREDWTIEAPVRTRLELDARMLPTGRRKPAAIGPGPLADRTFDDAFADVQPGDRFSISDGTRTLAVTMAEGYRFAQIYAPPDAAVVCFEPMTAPANALATGDGLSRVEPGAAFTARFEVAVESGQRALSL